MKSIMFGILIFIMFAGCTTVRTGTARPKQTQPQYQYQPPRTTRLYFHYNNVNKKPYIVLPTRLPLKNPKPKKLR